MAIKITEDGAVRYVNENDVDRTMFPNLTGAMGDEQYDALNGRLTVVEGKVSDLEECCGDVNNDITELKNDLSEKADKSEALSAYIVETETGSIASFTDGADDVPVKDLTVAIEPVQDLHGQSAPYPAGGGKNKLQTTLQTRTVAGITATVSNDGSIVISGTSTDVIYFVVNDNFNSTALAGNLFKSNFVDGVNYRVISASNFTEIQSLDSGYSETAISDNGTGLRLVIRINNGLTFNNVKVEPRIGATSSDIASWTPYSNICPISGWTGANVTVNDEVLSVNWETEAGTVYGGTLDVVSGVLTVDTARIALSSLDFTVINDNYFYSGVTGIAYNSARIWSDTYKSTVPYNGYNEINFENCSIAISQSNARIAIRDDSYSDVASFVASLTDKYIVYGLATPQTYQLTPQEVSTILGQNNIFADTGNVTVQYRADTKLYIDKVVNA